MKSHFFLKTNSHFSCLQGFEKIVCHLHGIAFVRFSLEHFLMAMHQYYDLFAYYLIKTKTFLM